MASATASTILQASARQPGAAAGAAAAGKRADYGDLGAHKMLPLVVEAQGAWGKDAKWFFNYCKQRVAIDDYDASGLPRDHSRGCSNKGLRIDSVSIVIVIMRGTDHLRQSHKQGRW